jgi:uncharacterized protein YPO0396
MAVGIITAESADSAQFKAVRLQLFNWGTFSGLHDIRISERGFLFIGKSGTGKSTLLDAFSALLVPPRWLDFNAAAREAERTGRDRSVMSYIRGAWAEQKDGDSGEIATRYLRPNTTWSALALTYKSGSETVALVQLFWVRGTSAGSQDVRRYFLIFERDVDLREFDEFGSNFDVRKLKLTHPDAFAREDFRPYSERFRRLLDIENEAALRLLHKTQSAKNLGDLNPFLRDFMLDKPQTFVVADRLINEFGELSAAHQAVVTAREQVQILKPSRDEFERMQQKMQIRESLRALESHLHGYVEFRRLELLQKRLAGLDVQAMGIEAEVEKNKTVLEAREAEFRDLERQHREAGGDLIERWEADKRNLEDQRANRVRKHDQVRDACTRLKWPIPKAPQEFAELIGRAREEVESWEEGSNVLREQLIERTLRKKEVDQAFIDARREIEALRSQPSNIPADMLGLRRRIAEGVGIPEAALPFAGELIQLKQTEAEWRRSIERILRNFAVSLLVDDRNYSSVAGFINSNNLGQRLFYYRTVMPDAPTARPVSANSLFRKMEFKQCGQEEWLKTELRSRFDYACVDSMAEFRRSERAVTREGQIKHSKTRHEKDDRRGGDGRLQQLLGFDNREKREEFEAHARDLAGAIAALDQEIRKLQGEERLRMERRVQCQTLVNLQWQEIDLVSVVEQIAAIERKLEEARQGDHELRRIGQLIERQRKLVTEAREASDKSRLAYKGLLNQIDEIRAKIAGMKENPPKLLHELREDFDSRFTKSSISLALENLDQVENAVLRGIHREGEQVAREISASERAIEGIFSEFFRKWPEECGDLQPSLGSASDFFAKLSRLELDGLPAHEHRFFELLRNQSHQNLAALATHLNNARKEILGRMDIVNDSLRSLPFNQTVDQTTYLQIEVSDKQLAVVREFKQEIQQALSHAWTEDREDAEARFLILRRIVERLSSQATEDKHWRDLVLDVRQHVEFIGREFDEENREVEIYRSGAGKSGGQRQKLATTCLAAALRYQLGGLEHGVPRYSTVVLDEAFDKADNDFTALAMNIFKSFGFQMIVATPLKSVMTLEPFIGGACFVDISDRRTSGVMLIEYEDDRHRLKLPDIARVEVDVEIS